MIPTAPLGNTDMRISTLGLGAWAIGSTGAGLGYGAVPRQEAVHCVEAYLEAGGNFLDTARYYNDSESILGEVLRAHGSRDHVVLASKTVQNDPAGIRADLETSLRELQTEVIDLYYIHFPPEDREGMARDLEVFEELRDQGKIRAIGASLKGPTVTEATVALIRQYLATDRLQAIQLIYSVVRQKNAAVFAEAQRRGVSLIGRTALESGFLTGKFGPEHVFPEGDHRARVSAETRQRLIAAAAELAHTAVPEGYDSFAQVALRFAMRPTAVTSTIVGATSARQMARNLEVLSLPPLPDELVTRLETEFANRTEEFNL